MAGCICRYKGNFFRRCFHFPDIGHCFYSIDFSAGDTTIFRNTPVTFNEVTTGGYINTNETYLWSFPGATPNTSTDQNPTVSYSDTGRYNVTLKVNRGGQIDSITKTSYIKVTPGGVGIQNIIASDMIISPNPNNGNFKVQYPGNFDMKITNVSGITLYEKSNCRNEENIRLKIKSGTYLLCIKTDKGESIKKFVVD